MAIQELNVLKFVLDRPGGVCEQILADPTKASKLANIIATVNSGDNLAFLVNQVETQKSVYTQGFVTGNQKLLAEPASQFAFLAVANYLETTRQRSQGVADALDRAIAQEFGEQHGGVVNVWNSYLRQVQLQAFRSITSMQEIKKAANNK